ELKRATYRVRGEVIDVHPAESDVEAIRIEQDIGQCVLNKVALFQIR
ncbi:MAG: hypothetical protein RLZZ69_434, partial [Cyanobacteriota bacterium]